MISTKVDMQPLFSYLYAIDGLPDNKQLCIAIMNDTIRLSKFDFSWMDTFRFRIRWVRPPDFIRCSIL